MDTLSLKTRPRRLSLRAKLVLYFTTFAIIVSAFTAGTVYFYLRNQIFISFQQRLKNIVEIAALAQDGDAHARLSLPEDSYSAEYNRLNAINQAIIDSDPDIIFIYTMRKNDNGEIYFVLDAGRNINHPDQAYIPAYAGSIYEQPTQLLVENFDTLDHAIVEPSIYEDDFSSEYGTFLSAYAPIYRSDGTVEAIIGVDISARAVQASTQKAALVALGGFFFRIPIIVIVMFIVGTWLTRPIIKLTQGAQIIAGGNLSHRLDIHTGDEVEELAINFNKMSMELERLFGSMEERIRERTKELEFAGQNATKRSAQFVAIAKIGQEIANVESIEFLLPRVTALISEQLGFYHAGIFINDENNQYAVLRATNSEGGHRMLTRGHRLEIGQTGIVGYVAHSGIPRIALDTETDTVFFNNPDLPLTHSEIALPLQTSSRIIGVLDVQSEEMNAFSQEDIEILSVLADQISIAIEHTRLLQETRRSLEESQRTYHQFIRQEWQWVATEQAQAGFRYASGNVTPLDKAMDYPEIRQAISSGKIQATTEKSGGAKLAIPITLHGEVIGAVDIRAGEKHTWSQDEIDIVQASTDRVALALENARLIANSQKRAAKERTIGEISGKIGSSIDIDTIVATAVEEMGNILPDAEITIQFEKKGNQK